MAEMIEETAAPSVNYMEDTAPLRRMLDSYRTATEKNARECATDRDYYDGPGQIKADWHAVLAARKQPAIWTNRVQPVIDGIVGLLASGRTDPRAYPRNPDDEQAADVATKALRFMADKARFDALKLQAANEFFIEGTAAAVVEVDGETDITVTQIRWSEFFFDPRSRKHNFSDARYLGMAKWMYADDVAALYPEAYKAMGDPVEAVTSMGGVGGLFDDKPESVLGWVDSKARRLMVVEVYYQERGEWMRCVFCAAGVFEKGPSPYQDERGRTRCPIKATSCYVDRDLMRYGRVRNMRPIQDEVNARRSRSLHIANSRQIQERELGSGMGDAETARMEAAKADGVIPSGWQIVPTRDMAVDNQALLAEAKGELERMGPTPAVLGRQGGASSGRERLVLQQAGMTELAPIMAEFTDWENEIYRAMWLTARQFKQDPWWVRVTDDLKAAQFVQLNGPEGPAIAELDVDIIVDSVADTANLAQEIWQELVQLLQMYPPEDARFLIAVEMSPIHDKARIVERIKAFQEEQKQQQQASQQQAQAVAQQAMALQAGEAQAKIAVDQTRAMKQAAEADAITQENDLRAASAAMTAEMIANTGMLPA